MAMLLFTGLNGLGVVFLVYVLVQFWNEWHRSKKPGAMDEVIELPQKNRPTVVVVRRPISGGLQVEPAPVSGGLQVADAPLARQSSAASGKPALWRRRVEPAPVSHSAHASLSVVSTQEPRRDRDVDSAGEVPMRRHSAR